MDNLTAREKAELTYKALQERKIHKAKKKERIVNDYISENCKRAKKIANFNGRC